MLIPTFVSTDYKPKIFINLNNNYWYYNYNIQEIIKTIPSTNDDGEITEEEKTYYNYLVIKMYGKPTYKKAVEAVIKKYITTSQELDYVNTRNKINLGLLVDEDEIAQENEKYESYLNQLAEIKANVKKDFGIS